MTVIETERLALRTWRKEDKAPFAEMNADPEVMRYFPKALDRAGSDALVEKIMGLMAENGFGLWAAEEKERGEFAGFIGFHPATFPARFTPCIEIGWRLRRASWGKGLATEGASACLGYGFSKLGLTDIFSFTASTNAPSINVMRKIGLRERGTFEHPNIAEGNPLRPHVLYGITAAEYAAAHGD